MRRVREGVHAASGAEVPQSDARRGEEGDAPVPPVRQGVPTAVLPQVARGAAELQRAVHVRRVREDLPILRVAVYAHAGKQVRRRGHVAGRTDLLGVAFYLCIY